MYSVLIWQIKAYSLILCIPTKKPKSPTEFLSKPSTDLISVLLGCQKWGRKKKHRTSTHSQNLHFLRVTSALFWAIVRCPVNHLKSPAQLRESHFMIPCVSCLCHPTVIQVQYKYFQTCLRQLLKTKVDTYGSLSQRETLLLGDPVS